jgi:nucleoside-diphosphate kinase
MEEHYSIQVKFCYLARCKPIKNLIMAGNITLTMIKPDAVDKNYTGAILHKINDAGFRVRALKYLQLTKEQAATFYLVHCEKEFYGGLVEFMSSGPIVAALLEKEDAISSFRELIGATNPANAAPGTIRALFAEDLQRNAVHGSDSDENAIIESDFFFSKLERL